MLHKTNGEKLTEQALKEVKKCMYLSQPQFKQKAQQNKGKIVPEMFKDQQGGQCRPLTSKCRTKIISPKYMNEF